MGPIPPAGSDLHFIVGYKGAEIRWKGVPLVTELVSRLRQSGAVGEVFVAGPSRVFSSLTDSPVIDTDASVGQNIATAMAFLRSTGRAEGPVGFMACDVLPRADEIRELLEQLLGPGEAASAGPAPGPEAVGEPPAAMALPLIQAAQDLGASRWKPRYGIRPAPGEPAIPFLPGHLLVAWPSRLRLEIIYRLLSLAYRERNRDFSRRPRSIVARLLGTLLFRDLTNLLRLKFPLVTYMVLRHGLATFFRWRRGDLDLDGLARGLGAVLVRRKHFRRWGGGCIRLVASRHISFAKDIDTREELAEMDGGAGAPSA